ncbi:unnamed protein product, partial [marine sediment metagenome]
MEDRDKDKEQLQNELMGLHEKIAQLEHVKASQKQTEKKLVKSEELYRLIAENTREEIKEKLGFDVLDPLFLENIFSVVQF